VTFAPKVVLSAAIAFYSTVRIMRWLPVIPSETGWRGRPPVVKGSRVLSSRRSSMALQEL